MVTLAFGPRLRRSPYFDAVHAAGMTHAAVYNKMILPLSFGDLRAEYRRLIEGVAMWDVAAERQIEVRGPDASTCVQYLTSRDLGRMTAGQGHYVAMCDHAGHIINDPVLLKLGDDRYWFSIADSDMLFWVRAVAAERGYDVEVSEPDVSPLAVQGPLAEDLVADLFGDSIRSIGYFRFIETDLHGIPLVLCRSGWSKQGGFELFLQDGERGGELWDLVERAGRPYGIGPGGPNHVERVESGLLSWGGDTTPDSSPFEAGMARYVHLDTEAEYIGREALRRERDAGGPPRLLTGLAFEPSDDAADPLPLPERIPCHHEGRPCGTVSALVHSPRLGHDIAIAQVERGLVERAQSSGSGADITVDVDAPGSAGPRPARIVSLPFI